MDVFPNLGHKNGENKVKTLSMVSKLSIDPDLEQGTIMGP